MQQHAERAIGGDRPASCCCFELFPRCSFYRKDCECARATRAPQNMCSLWHLTTTGAEFETGEYVCTSCGLRFGPQINYCNVFENLQCASAACRMHTQCIHNTLKCAVFGVVWNASK